jgi:hypothetical protein
MCPRLVGIDAEPHFIVSDSVWLNYDVTPDGKRLLMVRGSTEEAPTRVNVVLNWLNAR